MARQMILASASPRRQELIRLFGRPVTIQAADVDEESADHADPAEYVIGTARLKAEAVAAQAPADSVVIAADTTVALDGRRLGKPADGAEARQMLRDLRGRTHQVYTGIVVIDQGSGRRIEDVAAVSVPMRDYSDAEIEAYVASGDPLDKAGAYAIQHRQFRPVARLEECYAAVVGLPLCHLARALRRSGIPLEVDIARRCQEFHQYDCPVFQAILEGG